MQNTHTTTSGQFTRALLHSNSLFTPKRVGFTLAGAFVCAGAALTLSGGVSSANTGSNQVKTRTAQNSNIDTQPSNTSDQPSTSVSAEKEERF
jgi:hypothetical protein